MIFKQPACEIIAQLNTVAPGRVHAGDAIKKDYAHDEMPIYGEHMPDVVVEVASTEEVSQICKICYENDIPIVPRGAGTGLCGGCVAIYGGVLIDTNRMNKILGYDMGNFIVRVQSGVLLDDLANDCIARGIMYPPDPGEKFATLGGNVAGNAGGMRAVKYGTTRDYVRAMTVVLPCGDVVRFGGEVSKNTSGYSLMHLMVGSEGTLGIITELSLKVIPQPNQTVSLLAMFEDLDTCISCVPKIKMAGLAPQALEFLTRESVIAIEEFLGKKVYPRECEGVEVGAYLLVTFDSSAADEMDQIMESAGETFAKNSALDVMVYDTPEQLRNVWAVRGACLEAILANYKLTDECDVVVPIPQIAPFVKYASGLESEVHLHIRANGHAGDGNVHINVCANDLEKEEFMKRAEHFMKLVYAKAAELGGQISGEHGIGCAKIAYLEDFLGETHMQLMRNIKTAFDPKGLLNPGKVCYKL
jgi:glycolate oxidase